MTEAGCLRVAGPLSPHSVAGIFAVDVTQLHFDSTACNRIHEENTSATHDSSTLEVSEANPDTDRLGDEAQVKAIQAKGNNKLDPAVAVRRARRRA